MNLDDAVHIRHPPLYLTQTFVHVTREPGVLSLNRELVTLTKTPSYKLLPGCVLSHPQILSLKSQVIHQYIYQVFVAIFSFENNVLLLGLEVYFKIK